MSVIFQKFRFLSHLQARGNNFTLQAAQVQEVIKEHCATACLAMFVMLKPIQISLISKHLYSPSID